MKRIKHLKDIEREKLQLRVLQLEQEKALRESWSDLKHNLKPGTLLRNKLSALTHREPGEGHWINGLLHYGTSYLGRKAGTRLEDTLNKGIDLVTQKIEEVTEKLKSKTRR